MNWLAPKLSLRVAQKQILTPGLVQMVSVLALNRLELREMITQEIMANPVLDEVTEESAAATDRFSLWARANIWPARSRIKVRLGNPVKPS